MINVKILVVTDNQNIASNLRERLTKLGYQVIGFAASEQESIAKIRESKPDVIMTDINLRRGRGGIKTGGLIQSTYNIPIIYITRTIGQATIQRARSTGPFGYIFEPFDDSQLIVTIETALTRHQLERKLRESRQWLNTTLTSIGDGVIATDEHGLVRFINPAAMELTEWNQHDAIGKSIHEVFTFVDNVSRKPMDMVIFKDQIVLRTKSTLEGNLVSKRGRFTSVEANARLIHGDGGGIYGMVLIFRDITKQKEALSEIQRQADRAEALVRVAAQINNQIELETLLNTICVITNRTLKATGTAVFLRDSKSAVFRNRAAYSDDPLLKAFEGAEFEIPGEIFEAMLGSEKPVAVIPDMQNLPTLPYSEMAKNQNIRTLVIVALFRRDQLIGTLISVFTKLQIRVPEDDIALLRGLADQATNAITNAELFEQVRIGRERQRILAKSLVDIQESERRHIAQELHDHLGQTLTGMQFALESAKKQADGKQRLELDEIQKTVSEVIERVREMSLNLRPSMLDDLGLLPTLRWHFDRYTSQTEIKVKFQTEEFSRRLPTDIETTAYRIIQEALTNVARHAGVREVFVGLAVDGNTLWVEVLDKGKGFERSTVLDHPSSGLGGMRERAVLVGGYLILESYINQGTQIVAALPLDGKILERRKYDRDRPARG